MNGGLARGGHRRESVGDRIARSDDRESGSPEKIRGGPTTAQGDVRASSGDHFERREASKRSRTEPRGQRSTKGTRRWKAPRVTPKRRLSRGGVERDLGGSLTPPTHERDPRGSARGDPAKAGSRRGKRERRQGCQRLGRSGRRGKTTPTLLTRNREVERPEATRVRVRSAEAVLDVVKRRVPQSGRAEPRSPRDVPRGESRGSELGTREVWVHAVVRVAEVGSSHRASSAPRGRKASWGTEDASREEARSAA